MRESIRISNLGPLKNVYIEEIKPLTVLIGESGSGKSTLMKVIALFRWLYKMQNIRSYLKQSDVKSPFRFRMDTYFKNCGFEEYIESETEITYQVSFDNNVKYELKFIHKRLVNPPVINENHIHFNKISFISETRNIIPLWANKGASLTGGYLGFYFHEVYRDFDIASDIIKEFDLSHLDLKFAVRKSSSGKKFKIESKSSSEKYELDFRNSSSGTQTSTPILLISKYFSRFFNFEDSFNRSVLSYLSSTDSLTQFRPVKDLSEIGKKVYLHIEEPELSLFPDAQCKLLDDLVNTCYRDNNNEIEMFISTHSPYLINYLNLLIQAYDNNSTELAKYNYDCISVYQISNGELQNLVIKNARLINTNPLSDTINYIYDKYNDLREHGQSSK